MLEPGNAAPRDTERLITAIRQALADIPEVYRKAALKHATDTVWRDLLDQSEQGKAAALRAGPEPGAKAAAAIEAIQHAAERPGRA